MLLVWVASFSVLRVCKKKPNHVGVWVLLLFVCLDPGEFYLLYYPYKYYIYILPVSEHLSYAVKPPPVLHPNDWTPKHPLESWDYRNFSRVWLVLVLSLLMKPMRTMTTMPTSKHSPRHCQSFFLNIYIYIIGREIFIYQDRESFLKFKNL